MEFIICTDGSAVVKGPRSGLGGIGAYIYNSDSGDKIYISKGFSNTKTGRMEITAVLYALSYLAQNFDIKTPITAHIYSDSEYVVKSFTEGRLEKWAGNGWVNTSGEVKNRDLWEKIINVMGELPLFSIKFHHIKGHTIDNCKDAKRLAELLEIQRYRGNWIADRLADVKSHTEYEKDL